MSTRAAVRGGRLWAGPLCVGLFQLEPPVRLSAACVHPPVPVAAALSCASESVSVCALRGGVIINSEHESPHGLTFKDTDTRPPPVPQR